MPHTARLDHQTNLKIRTEIHMNLNLFCYSIDLHEAKILSFRWYGYFFIIFVYSVGISDKPQTCFI